MYTVLQCFGRPFHKTVSLGAPPLVEGVESWLSGRFIATTVPQPVPLVIDPDEPGDLLEMYQLGMVVMSGRLVEAMKAAGVDNLQVFDAVIRGPESRRVVTDYKVVNVVGTVACADLSNSVYDSPRGAPIIDVDFERLAIDDSRAGGRLLFRLAECVSAIIVHDRVRRELVASGFDMLTFQDPSQFVG